MCSLEGNDVDHEVEAVRDGQGTILIAVERDVLVLLGRRALALAGERQLPAVSQQRMRYRRADVAGAAEDERALCDR
jgi:hypothetical protein